MAKSSHQREAVSVGVAVVDEDGIEAGLAGPAGNRGDDAGGVAYGYGLRDPSLEDRTDDGFVNEIIAHLELSPGVPLRHAGGRAGAAGRAVDGLIAVENGVAGGGAG